MVRLASALCSSLTVKRRSTLPSSLTLAGLVATAVMVGGVLLSQVCTIWFWTVVERAEKLVGSVCAAMIEISWGTLTVLSTKKS
jgi:hypothetical protein